MIATIHVLAGLAITAYMVKETKSPITAVVAGASAAALSHAGLDLLPHKDPDLGTEYIITGSLAFLRALIDNLIGLGICIYWVVLRRRLPLFLAGWVVFWSWSPDFFQYLVAKNLWTGILASAYYDFHRDFLHEWKPYYNSQSGEYWKYTFSAATGIACIVYLRKHTRSNPPVEIPAVTTATSATS